MRLYLFGDCILKFVVLEYFEYKCHPGHVLLNNGPQPFWHQGLVLWKTIFPRTGGGGGGMMVQAVM